MYTNKNASESLDTVTDETSPDNSFGLEELRRQLYKIIPNGSETSLKQANSTPYSDEIRLLQQELIRTQIERDHANCRASRFHQDAVMAQREAEFQAQITSAIAFERDAAQKLASNFSQALGDQERSFNSFLKGVNKSMTDKTK